MASVSPWFFTVHPLSSHMHATDRSLLALWSRLVQQELDLQGRRLVIC
jgi:hypothetical protein